MSERKARWVWDQTFVAVDSRGRGVVIHRETRTATWGNDSGTEMTVRGESRLVTTAGGPVDRVDAGVYVDLATGEILRSADPKAP